MTYGDTIARIDHLGIAVTDLEAVLDVYEHGFGLTVHHREVLEDQGVEAVALRVGESAIELLRPLGDDTPVGRFLNERGPGIHHVAYAVDDVAAVLGRLRAAGIRLVDHEPRLGLGGTKIAFVHPRSVGGVLTELVEHPCVSGRRAGAVGCGDAGTPTGRGEA